MHLPGNHVNTKSKQTMNLCLTKKKKKLSCKEGALVHHTPTKWCSFKRTMLLMLSPPTLRGLQTL